MPTRNKRRREARTAPPARPTRLHHLFEASCDARPGTTAVAGAAGPLTYAALDARANRPAHDILRRGVGPGAADAAEAEAGRGAAVLEAVAVGEGLGEQLGGLLEEVVEGLSEGPGGIDDLVVGVLVKRQADGRTATGLGR